ncbi:MAG: protein kinase [Gammaproteobacteria bacterium]|nr:protein kinase [Gammaproteobacteria bacterium]MCP4090055.1 protein kinase [Gammaproteobacteria bacterium]MCP4277055.1 protein kinase [Gammaproteobacteria bacterium]MCP4832722.1 protein kinase [Gammaproteobacteria bacterium]MCP4929915.1 protein kinase [Gammaproteobacteria bacterium]
MAEVWLASDNESPQDEPLVLKILYAQLADQPEFINRLNAEFEYLKQFQHPNIIRVYGCHVEAGRYFISMEYLPGGTAKNLLSKPWVEILKFLLPIADALDYIHQEGLVHRDVRAANIFLSEVGKPCLADFGLTNAATSATQGDAGVRRGSGGSLPSMSPQQLAGEQPVISDDIYAFGALLYELVSGEPLFHPDVTPERICNEVPPALSRYCAGIPVELDRLVAALLHKQAEQRPRGMVAVRGVLEALLLDAGSVDAATNHKDDGSIRPVGRRQSATSVSAQTFSPKPLRSAQSETGAGQIFYAAFGVLALIVLGVIFILPDMVADNTATKVKSEPSSLVVHEITSPDPVTVDNAIGREIADAALADLLYVSDSLRAQAVERWGGAEWFRAVNRVMEGDEFYKDRAFDKATVAYREALQILEPLTDKVAGILALALKDGETAINEGNQKLALERFDLALAIAPDNPAAQKGRERALKLDLVISLVAEASDSELASRWSEALAKYNAALDVDSLWSAALEGRERVSAIIQGNEYQVAMSSGYTALAGQDYAGARRYFEAALRARARDPDALQALDQIAAEQRLARVTRLSAEAELLRKQEDWPGAVKRYQSILSVDSSVISARNGLAISQQRAELDERLRGAISSPDRLSDQTVLQATRQLLAYARGIEVPGPILIQQVNDLEQALQRAVVPVAVRFESDGLTEVVIYKVGRFEPFVTREIELRPGVYTAVGLRGGYRDVRLELRVQPENQMQPVVIRCEDPI